MMPEKQSMSITRIVLFGFTAIMLFFIAYGLFSYNSRILIVLWFLLSGVIIFLTVKRAGFTERQLDNEREKYEKTFQSVPVWIVISTIEDGKYIEINEAYLNAMGYKREEIIGKSSLEIDSWVDPRQREYEEV